MKKFTGMRWWMVGLVTAGLIVNYLARNTLSVAAPTMMKELDFTTREYSYVVVAWQICYAVMQPIAGYVLDSIGTKLGFAVFALAWSVACAAAALATGWQSLAFLRGLLGMAEAAGIPAGVKATHPHSDGRTGSDNHRAHNRGPPQGRAATRTWRFPSNSCGARSPCTAVSTH